MFKKTKLTSRPLKIQQMPLLGLKSSLKPTETVGNLTRSNEVRMLIKVNLKIKFNLRPQINKTPLNMKLTIL